MAISGFTVLLIVAHLAFFCLAIWRSFLWLYLFALGCLRVSADLAYTKRSSLKHQISAASF